MLGSITLLVFMYVNAHTDPSEQMLRSRQSYFAVHALWHVLKEPATIHTSAKCKGQEHTDTMHRLTRMHTHSTAYICTTYD